MENYLHHAPFDTLTNAERNLLSKHSQMLYFAENETLPEQFNNHFFIIIKGKLKQYHDGELIAGLNTHDWFDTHSKNGETHTFVTSEQCLLYAIVGNTIKQVCEQNTTLKNLLFADLSERRAQYNARQAHYENQQLLHQHISTLGQHIKPPNFISANTSIRQATIRMNQLSAKHILVQDGQKIGMFTQADVCRAVGDGVDLQSGILPYVNFNISTIHQNQELSEALILMLEKKIHRLPIVDDVGNIIGIIGQTELLNFLANHSQLIVAKIDQVTHLDDLPAVVDSIGKFIRSSTERGVKTHIIARTVQSLNTQIFSKIWQIIVPTTFFDNTCLFVMGSEGRGEQIMRTDQDNALIIRDDFVFNEQEMHHYANVFNDTLAKLGYPYCDGNIMLNHERWRKTLKDFKIQINQWFSKGGESNIWLATLMDAHFVCGDKQLFDELYTHLFNAYTEYACANFINRFASSTLAMADSVHFWQKFTGVSHHDVDLKKAGIFPIVHGIRTLAFEHKITTTNTRLRIDELARLNVIEPKNAQNLQEALDFFLYKRLLTALNTSDKSARKVNPNTLSNFDRDLLKESLAVVKSFKSFITHYYRLDVFGV